MGQLAQHVHAFRFQLWQNFKGIAAGGMQFHPLHHGPRGLPDVLHRVMKLGDDTGINFIHHKTLLHLVQLSDGAGNLDRELTVLFAGSRANGISGKRPDWRQRIFGHDVSLALRTQLLRSGNRADKKLKLLLVLFASCRRRRPDAKS